MRRLVSTLTIRSSGATFYSYVGDVTIKISLSEIKNVVEESSYRDGINN